VLSGDPADPDRTSLALDQPVTIEAGPCRAEASAELQRDTQTNPITPQDTGLVSVVMDGDGDVDPRSVVVDSLRFGPPRVVEDGGGARAVRARRGYGRFSGSMSFLFPLWGANFRVGDTRCRLVGETEGGTEFAATDPIRVVRSAGGRDGRRDDGTDGTVRTGRYGRGGRGGRRGR